jgi:hypothetical protein
MKGSGMRTARGPMPTSSSRMNSSRGNSNLSMPAAWFKAHAVVVAVALAAART